MEKKFKLASLLESFQLLQSSVSANIISWKFMLLKDKIRSTKVTPSQRILKGYLEQPIIYNTLFLVIFKWPDLSGFIIPYKSRTWKLVFHSFVLKLRKIGKNFFQGITTTYFLTVCLFCRGIPIYLQATLMCQAKVFLHLVKLSPSKKKLRLFDSGSWCEEHCVKQKLCIKH